MTAPVEFLAQYATSVPDLQAAWAFVMAHIDRVGPNPSVKINPSWRFTPEAERRFEVVVAGSIEIKEASYENY